MKKTNVETLLKSYFYFNKQERKGIFALLIVLFGVILIPRVYSALAPPEPDGFTITELGAISDSNASDKKEAGPYSNKKHLFRFDPNTASDEELKTLGFTDKNIHILRNFLKAGGKFRDAQDLKKIYGMNASLLNALIPFVVVNEKQVGIPGDTALKAKKKSFQPVELNTADSVSVVSLYRIGPALTHRILDYRSKLGGFISLEQLKEIWGFDEDILYDLKDKIYVDEQMARKMNLNTVTLEELKTHPYFKYKLSNAIVNYRTQHGNYKSMSDLKQIVIVSDSILNRITPYLYIE